MMSKHDAASMTTSVEVTSGKSAGGIARAKKLTPEERSSIAREAATKRWSESAQPVVAGSADRPLTVGDVDIECYVLEELPRSL